MAELVDALVSNTNAARRAGSIPALGTKNPKTKSFRIFLFQISLFLLQFRRTPLNCI